MKYIPWLLLVLSAMPASAAEWVRVGTQGEGDHYYYDRSKLFINGEEVTYWKKVTFRLAQPVKEGIATSGLYRERIHCSEHTLKLISYLLYAADGSTIEYVANNEGEAAPIIPDTLGDVFEKTTCDLVRQKREEQRRHGEEPKKVESATTPTPVKTPEAKPALQKIVDPTPEKAVTPPSAVDTTTVLKPAVAGSPENGVKSTISTPPLIP